MDKIEEHRRKRTMEKFSYEVESCELKDLVLRCDVLSKIQELKNAYLDRRYLNSYGTGHNNIISINGTTGSGKTILAKAIANELCLPIFVVRYERLIRDSLQETIKNVEDLFDSLSHKQCVLFFDDFDMCLDRNLYRYIIDLANRMLRSHVFVVYAFPYSCERLRRIRYSIEMHIEDVTSVNLNKEKVIDFYVKKYKDTFPDFKNREYVAEFLIFNSFASANQKIRNLFIKDLISKKTEDWQKNYIVKHKEG